MLLGRKKTSQGWLSFVRSLCFILAKSTCGCLKLLMMGVFMCVSIYIYVMKIPTTGDLCAAIADYKWQTVLMRYPMSRGGINSALMAVEIV